MHVWQNLNFKMRTVKNRADLKIIEMQRKLAGKNCSDLESCSNWEVFQIRFFFTSVKGSDLEDI